MIKLYKHEDRKKFYKTKLLLQVHDELVFETTEKNIDETKNFIINIMMYAHEPIIKLDIPLEVSFGIGKNWQVAH